MPHDMNGNVLKVGDRVLIPAIVKTIQMSEDYCNLTAESTERMPGNDSLSTFNINTKQCAKGHVADMKVG